MATIKDLKRMCDSYKECNGCSLYIKEMQRCRPCDFYFSGNVDEVIDNWVLRHPVKTYMQDFFEKFPNARRNSEGVPKVCPQPMYPELADECHNNCLECWNQEMKEK